MSNKIILKHSIVTDGPPNPISAGEIAASLSGRQIFVGTDSSYIAFVDKNYVDSNKGHVIVSETNVAQTSRPKLQFTGNGVLVTDNLPGDKTVVTITGSDVGDIADGSLAYSKLAVAPLNNTLLGQTQAGQSIVGLSQASALNLLNVTSGATPTNEANVKAAKGITTNYNSTIDGPDGTLWGFVNTDGQMISASDDKLPTQLAVKDYVDFAATRIFAFKGTYDAVAKIPDLESASNTAQQNDVWFVNVEGTFYGVPVGVGDRLIAEIDNPKTVDEWSIIPFDREIPYAGEGEWGLIQIATASHMAGMSNDDFAVTPLKLASATIDGGEYT